VRASKVRHVYAQQPKKEFCYTGFRLSTATGDHNYIKANTVYMAIPVAQGGSLAVFEMDREDMRLGPGVLPVLDGHRGPVLDFDFNPFHTNLIASGGDDCVAKVWGIPAGGLVKSISESLADLEGHQKKITTVLHNPVADYVLATASQDKTVKIWDLDAQEEKCTIEHDGTLFGLSWSLDGEILASTSKDKYLRLIDPRSGEVTSKVEGHEGTRTMKVEFCPQAGGGSIDAFCTTGFTRQSKRQFKLWDSRNMNSPIVQQNIDQSAGAILPFYDEGTHLLYLAGKGDSNIRYYELVPEDPWQFYVSEFKGGTPARGWCRVPARANDTTKCEVTRILKLDGNQIVPLSFLCPRKSNLFQADLYPDAYAGKSTIGAEEFFSGKKGKVHRISMNPKDRAAGGAKPADEASNSGAITKKKTASQLNKEVKDKDSEIARLQALLKENNIKY